HLGQEGWTVQRLLRMIQVNLFERKTLKALFMPDKIPIKQKEAQLSLLL
ncbi:IS4 family transposase, partial [Acinetobacter sp. ANC 4862]